MEPCMHWYPHILEEQLRRRLDALAAAGGPRLTLTGDVEFRHLRRADGTDFVEPGQCLANYHVIVDRLFQELAQ